MRVAVLVLLVGCGKADTERAVKLFKTVELDTKPGLSGLAADDAALWTVSERGETAYRIALDTYVLEPIAVTGISGKLDLEGIAWLGGNRFALGTEGREDGLATVLLAERQAQTLAVTGAIKLPASRIGIEMMANHGAEGVCGIGETIIVAIEGAGTADGKRFAPIVRITNGEIARVHRLWLTSDQGKISALDCTIAADGTAEVIAIERHFKVAKLLRFRVPPADGDITPVELVDLGTTVVGRFNLEGIAKSGERAYAVSDNQWKTIQGASVLLVFEPTAVPP